MKISVTRETKMNNGESVEVKEYKGEGIARMSGRDDTNELW